VTAVEGSVSVAHDGAVAATCGYDEVTYLASSLALFTFASGHMEGSRRDSGQEVERVGDRQDREG